MTQNDRIERWMPVVGFEGVYEVSDLGRVRSYQNFGNGLRKEPRVMKPHNNCYGYPTVTLCRNGKRRQKAVHRLVADAFLGTPDANMQIDHVNGIKTDNRVSNLEWVTPKENTIRSVRLGLKPHGEKHRMSKLTEHEVAEIRALYKTGKYSHRSLAKDFGISHCQVGCIVRGEVWR